MWLYGNEYAADLYSLGSFFSGPDNEYCGPTLLLKSSLGRYSAGPGLDSPEIQKNMAFCNRPATTTFLWIASYNIHYALRWEKLVQNVYF